MRRSVAALTVFFVACGSGYKTRGQVMQEHFAVGGSWPAAIMSVEEAFGEPLAWSATCSTSLGSRLLFGRLSSNEYLIDHREQPERGSTGSQHQDRAAFRRALTTEFGRGQCEVVEVIVDRKHVADLRISDGRITEAAFDQR